MLKNKEKNFISAVLYLHDNAEQLRIFLPCLHGTLTQNFEKFEIICVNDSSTDASVQAIRDFAAQIDNTVISIIHMNVYQGIELAMNAGVDMSIGDFVFEFDTVAVNYSPGLIMEVYAHSLKGYDIVAAAPARNSQPSSSLFYWLYNRVTKNAYKLRSETFRVLTRRAINRIHSISRTIPYRKSLYVNSGLKMDTIVYSPKEKNGSLWGKSVQNGRRETAIDTFFLFTDIANKVATFLSAALLLFTLVSGIYTFVIYFGQNRPITGWTTTMLLLSGGFFGVFLLLTIVIRYLSILVNLVFKRQKYLIESIEKITK